MPLDADNNAVIVQSLDDVAAVLDIFGKAVAAGEMDTALSALAQCKVSKISGVRTYRLIEASHHKVGRDE